MKKNRRAFLAQSAAAAALAAMPGAACAAAPISGADRPNILWLVSEDNSPWLGCYGDPLADTPNLDRMAREGVRFTSAFANAPVCAPARFTIHTGVYASSAGTQHMRSCNPIPPGIRFFTQYLREAGYYCVNGQKTDYNTTGTPPEAWDSRRFTASLRGLKRHQPFFRFINYMTTHESSLHKVKPVTHDPAAMRLAPYHPDTPEIRHDYAQYYDQITRLDGQIGEALAELERQGLADDTIVFYFSDHGGVLPRSKRFLYDSGMRVPMIARFPEKYRHLAPSAPGSTFDQPVSFVDLAPTMMSIAGVPVPDYMQGRAFLGPQAAPAPQYVYGFRGRMDDRYDMSRAVRDLNFKYIRNYHPYLPWGRHLDYLWRMPATRSWEEMYQAGKLNAVQKRWFEPKPAEELYDLAADPYEINNLAGDPAYLETIVRMRDANRRFLLDHHDAGFLQEAEMVARAQGSTPYDLVRDPIRYDLPRVMAAAEIAGDPGPGAAAKLIELLKDHDSAVRYWGAVGCLALGQKSADTMPLLTQALDDDSASVSVAAAAAMFKLGRPGPALAAFKKALQDDNMYAGFYASDMMDFIGADDPSLNRLKNKAKARVRKATNLNALK
ncbi:MAG TPA: sulfatase-like hydrolase/transferase [bacterium]|nr:sulfatase-like hydrolase/transferase [bacterium]